MISIHFFNEIFKSILKLSCLPNNQIKKMDYLSLFKSYIDIAPNTFPECYAFSIHKAGSTLMHKMINEVCSATQISAISIPDIMFKEGVKPEEWNEDPALLELIVPGRIYYGFRYLPEILLSPTDLSFREKVRVVGA